MELISVILPVYKEPIKYIEESLESILKQSYDNLEVLVIIDAPDRKELVDFVVGKQKCDSRIRVILNKNNLGLTASLNKGVRAAHGDYIARMDADDISLPNRFERQLNSIKQNKLDLIGCSVICIDELGRSVGKKTVFVPVNDASIKRSLCHYNAVFHPTWFGRKEVFKSNKYYDFEACEDYEFIVRISLQGKRLGNVGEPLLKYRINSSSISSTKKIRQRVGALYIRKCYKNKRFCNYEEYMHYLESRDGVNDQRAVEESYKKRRYLNKCISNKSYLIFITYLIWYYLAYPGVRRIVNDEIFWKIDSKRNSYGENVHRIKLERKG